MFRYERYDTDQPFLYSRHDGGRLSCHEEHLEEAFVLVFVAQSLICVLISRQLSRNVIRSRYVIAALSWTLLGSSQATVALTFPQEVYRLQPPWHMTCLIVLQVAYLRGGRIRPITVLYLIVCAINKHFCTLLICTTAPLLVVSLFHRCSRALVMVDGPHYAHRQDAPAHVSLFTMCERVL